MEEKVKGTERERVCRAETRFSFLQGDSHSSLSMHIQRVSKLKYGEMKRDSYK